jgi:micrococcal nuclease
MDTVASRFAILAAFATLVIGASGAHAQSQAGPAYVTRVVDGDTLFAELGGRLESVRYLGMNTPWIEHPLYSPQRYATLAREANRRLVEGKWVRLVFDGEVRDQHGRLRAYVWVGDLFVNALLLHRGYGEAAVASSARYAGYFRMLQEGAQRDARGLWRDQSVIVYHRPRPTELAADASDYEFRGADSSGGRVFSAPAPFIPVAVSTPTYAPSGYPASGGLSAPPPPATVAPSGGTSSYSTPRGSMRR